MTSKTWLITGCSTGFGRELAVQALKRGERVVMTARNISKLEELAREHASHALLVPLDVTDSASMDSALMAANRRFGDVDVLVNNAGYGYFAAIEEGEEDEIRRQFETNLFGLISLTKRILPSMRARKTGHIVNFSSIGGLMVFPGVGYYNATKFAVEAFSESLALELAPFGVKVTIVEPGRFRTDWAGRSMVMSANTIADYSTTIGVRRKSLAESSGKQPGDPARGAAAIIKAVDAPEPPLRLLLGTDAYDLAVERLAFLRKGFDAWKTVTTSTDFTD